MQNLCYNHFKIERKQELLKSYIAIYRIYLKIKRKQSYITIYLIYLDIKQMNSKYDVGYNKLQESSRTKINLLVAWQKCVLTIGVKLKNDDVVVRW